MADETPPPALDRIDRAIARIEAAVADRDRVAEAAVRRHAALRARIEEAVSTLDDVIARGEAGDGPS
jgi:hypothetical protein